MTRHEIDQGKTVCQRMAEEERIREKTDEDGNRWTMVYFGDGAHFRNCEEVDSKGFQCYEESGEKMYRIWVVK